MAFLSDQGRVAKSAPCGVIMALGKLGIQLTSSIKQPQSVRFTSDHNSDGIVVENLKSMIVNILFIFYLFHL